MKKSKDDLKEIVKSKYSEIAINSNENVKTSCCSSSGCCSETDYNVFSQNYEKLQGYNPDADLGLGCGIPTEFAQILKGDTVIDLGSGAGNDCFVARALVGYTGRVIGIDMTEAMIEKARVNTAKLGFTNIEFHLGDIENLPVPANIADVVISNCVLNLVPDKVKAFNEISRVLKYGGHLSVSDIVLRGVLHPKMQQAAEMYAGCVSGAVQYDEYLKIIDKTGFTNIKVQKDKAIVLPDEIMLKYLDTNELAEFRKSDVGIYSITVYAEKPTSCGCGCC